MKTLLTGGAGFIGSNMAQELLSLGRTITVLDNLYTGNRDNIPPGVEVIHKSCEDFSTKEKFDEIYHLGVYSSSPQYKRNPKLCGAAINGMINVLEIARQSDCPVVFASSSSLYSELDPPHKEDMIIKVTDYYTEARLAMERMAELYGRLYGVKSAAMRFFSVYGPTEKAKGEFANILTQFLWSMQRGERPLIFGDGKQTRDFTHVRDVIRACMTAMNAMRENKFDREIFNVGTGVETSFNEIVDALNKALGTNIQAEHRENAIKNYVSRTKADTRKSENILGFKARITLADGINRLIEAYPNG
ncbi:MAG: NAD-dependent epimerase/dehydratase family protein, partial [Candidatus Aenigmarchaeota archaeon]|nr:NAD-dependent epimerase/dehydratase family protein [Candidatus Aenigmarchaeota archaeon]